MLEHYGNLRVRRITIKTNRKDRKKVQASLKNWVDNNLSAENIKRNIFYRYGLHWELTKKMNETKTKRHITHLSAFCR